MSETLPPQEEPASDEVAPDVVVVKRSSSRQRWTRRLVIALLSLIGMLALAIAVLDSGIGHRYVADRIAALAPASGLRIKIGRIEGSLYGSARLRDVTLSDPKGVFARVPVAELDWRPLNWFRTGLDVRKLVLRRGLLVRLPQLNPGDPDAPLLPKFDIRVDHLELDKLTIARGVIGPPRKVDLVARVDIRKGRALVQANTVISGGDKFFVLLDSEPSRDKFAIKLDYAAPKGGLLAGLAGTDRNLRVRMDGHGGWKRWDGFLVANQDGKALAALQLTNRAGRYGVLGLAWPGGMLSGFSARAAGDRVVIAAYGTLVDSVLKGDTRVAGQGLAVHTSGTVDLGENRFENFRIDAASRAPEALLPGARIEGALLDATLDGPFRNLSVEHRLRLARLVSGTTRIEGLGEAGTANYDGTRWTLPLNLAVARVVSGNAMFDPHLVGIRGDGMVVLAGNQLMSDNLVLAAPGLDARLALRGDMARGTFGIAGPIEARGLALDNIGTADATARIVLKAGAVPWNLQVKVAGRLAKTTNSTLTTIAGSGIRFSGDISLGASQPALFRQATLSGSKLSLGVAGRLLADGRTVLAGKGRQADYGPFTVEATIAGDGPHAVLVFADPLPAAGLKDVRVALSPIAQGFRIETSGGSTLGPFEGLLNLFSPPDGPTRIEVARLDVWKTAVAGTLTLGSSAASGHLTLDGGGVKGAIDLAPQGGGQGFTVSLVANDARFGGDNPLTIGTAHLDAQGLLLKGHTTITGSLLGQDIAQGRLQLARIAASARVVDGNGQVTASLAGRRGSRFELQAQADFTPQRVAVAARGQFANRPIIMPRRAVLTAQDGGWRLAPTQLDHAGGRVIASGLFGGGANELNLALADMPLSLVDIFAGDLGLGGRISGLVDYRAPRRGAPTAEIKVKVRGLTRSGLVLTSRPTDLALVASLAPDRLEARAVATEDGKTRGRVQARIVGLGEGGHLIDRLQNGALFAQLRYSGPADALWRLAALDSFDLSGPIEVAADATGSLASPTIRGSLAGDGLTLQSSLTGTNITKVRARGSFAGSRLMLSELSGQAGPGQVSGTGTFDLSELGAKGPGIDLRLSARNAALLSRADMAATVTGPILIKSDGVGGVIAGRLAIERASWRLGRAAAVEELPNIKTREINIPADARVVRRQAAPWRFLIDVAGESRVEVSGMGLDSEWGANVRLRGTTDLPTITGRADLVRGGYEFAGKRFEITRGRIMFDGESPPDPRLDIAAENSEQGLTARVTVTGTALRPEISFSSTPALPEDELLSRLLFGTSITDISAPEALQLGAAIAALRGGGGIDPVNKLRRAIGLDRLRILPADAATGRGTGVAVGKNIGRRVYAEIVTDGRGYSATQLEYRVTSWLSILSSVSTIGQQSINVKASKDY